MPKKNNKTELTLEEKLNNALVPIEEQPYEIPENWCWSYLKHVANWGSGGTPSRKIESYYNGTIPWIKTGELNNSYIYDSEEKITEEAINNSNAKLYPKNTIAIAMYGATIGKVGIFGIEATTNQACACAICNQTTNYLFLFYYLLSQKNNFIKKSRGGAQPNISQELIKSHLIPLPPLPEQQRIVDLIERLFAKLDEAKEKVQTAIDSFELRKAAILHKAFTGELTKVWRAENGRPLSSFASQKPLPPTANALGADLKMCPYAGGEAGVEATIQQDAPPEFLKKIAGGAVERSETEGVLLDQYTTEGLPLGWKKVILGDVIHLVADKYNPPLEDDSKISPFLKGNGCDSNQGDFQVNNRKIPQSAKADIPLYERGSLGNSTEQANNIKYVGLEHIEKNNGIIGYGSVDEVKSTKNVFKKGDLLYGKLRPYLNKHDVADFDGVCSTDILVYRTNEPATAFFINYLFSTVGFIQYTVENSNGINLPRTSSKAIANYQIPLPPLPEQKEIVRILDTLLEKSDKAKELAENALENIETLKKTILAKAFRGLLGTNRADEASSLELLKEVL